MFIELSDFGGRISFSKTRLVFHTWDRFSIETSRGKQILIFKILEFVSEKIGNRFISLHKILTFG